MDKKNTTIGVLLIIAAIASFILAPKAPPRPAPVIAQPTAGSPTIAGAAVVPALSPSDATFAAVAKDDGSAKVITLANDFIEVAFTDMGGAIRDVGFKKYPAVKGESAPYVFNQLHADPMLAFTQDSFPGLDRSVRYEIVSQTASEVVFRAVFENRIEVIRRYTVQPSDVPPTKGDPYQLRHETTFRNLTDQAITLPRVALSLGTASLADINDKGLDLSLGFNDGKNVKFVRGTELAGGSFLSSFGLGRRDPIPFIDNNTPVVWASVKNQFFTAVLTPDQPGAGTTIRRVELPPFPGTQNIVSGVTGSARFELPMLTAHGETKLGAGFYVGPKEYKRLSNSDVFKHDEDKVMDFGKIFGIFSQMLLTMMTWIHGWAGNWGVAIILTTLLIKIASLPFTLSAARSAKRMQKLQPQMAAIKEKFKDNPQKMQQANMALFKENKVNPLGSCLPVMIPMPFFFGFFTMLRSISELRFGDFLWVHDLAGPDTIAHLAGYPVNLLPILLGITMIVQTKLVPQPNMDTDQAKMMATMMKWMPLIYVVMCYTFSCALALYSTVNGLFTIGQQLYINRQKDPVGVSVAANAGRVIKNVTPKKK
jgi:YidC/Oxa1 family membrane protein insertase